MTWKIGKVGPGKVRASGTHGDYLAFHLYDTASGWHGRTWSAELRQLPSSPSADATFGKWDSSTLTELDAVFELSDDEWADLDPGVIYHFEIRTTDNPAATLLSGTIKGRR